MINSISPNSNFFIFNSLKRYNMAIKKIQDTPVQNMIIASIVARLGSGSFSFFSTGSGFVSQGVFIDHQDDLFSRRSSTVCSQFMLLGV